MAASLVIWHTTVSGTRHPLLVNATVTSLPYENYYYHSVSWSKPRILSETIRIHYPVVKNRKQSLENKAIKTSAFSPLKKVPRSLGKYGKVQSTQKYIEFYECTWKYLKIYSGKCGCWSFYKQVIHLFLSIMIYFPLFYSDLFDLYYLHFVKYYLVQSIKNWYNISRYINLQKFVLEIHQNANVLNKCHVWKMKENLCFSWHISKLINNCLP